MNGEDQYRQPALETWQAIADYLGVAKRTAQNYERCQKLPVYRLRGDKARVWAFAAELDAWREQFRQMLAGDSAAGGASVGLEPESFDSAPAAEYIEPESSTVVGQELAALAVRPAEAEPAELYVPNGGTVRRQWLRYAVTAAGGLGVGIAAVKMPGLFRTPQQPTAYRVEGSTLVVLGQEGSELWRYTFPKQMPEQWYRDRFVLFCLFGDLEASGRISTLFSYIPADLAADRSLVCFNSIGQIHWKFAAGREVTDNLGRTFAPPYGLTAFAVVRPRDSKSSQVVVSSLHNWSFPNQVALLDGKTGKLISEYWHRGHLTELAVADLDHDGHPEILLGGVNDAVEYKCATVVVFDHRRVSGSTRDPSGQPYFQGMPSGTEKWTVFFPRTPISNHEEFNRVESILVTADRIRVVVGEGPRPQNVFAVVYEFDYNLRPINAVLSVDLVGRYLELQDDGKLPRESAYVTADRLMGQVRVIKGDGS